MRNYVVATGMVFVLLTVVHLWRMVEEGVHVNRDPFFVGVTLLAALFSGWAWRVFRQLPR